jgi:hypothetical protein
MGYYTLSGASFERGHLSNRLRKKIPYSNMPAVLLGRLAIDQRIQRKGFGELLIVDAIHKVRATAGQIGIYAMFVEAHPGASSFYKEWDSFHHQWLMIIKHFSTQLISLMILSLAINARVLSYIYEIYVKVKTTRQGGFLRLVNRQVH